ncbi:DUF1810 domain-containing protein [Massilia cavernae]|uniref:DUF1810 domain-containing protein n=1 Tax=Massilia cavernae TaxID=2320864 RepID=A0A418Y7Z8_9BURK|nr:DUF1810 domain-containing protein [Massilia cavernae]RJG27221.1 DUF1810 domain-containing protein [Massilia cavernae]
MDDQFDLARFERAQDPVYGAVLGELRTGRKTSHWMWFIFPQIAGLGRSSMAQHYAISSLEEACAYLAHPVLGSRLRECSALALAASAYAVDEIFGYPDDMKFHSSMTLFAAVPGADPVFAQCLEQFFGGVPDALTLPHLKE